MIKIINRFSFIIIFVIASVISQGQEFLANVQINSQQVEGTDKRVFENMQSAITEFINNRRWSNYDFMPEERIECSMVININSRPSTDQFVATLNLVASRPIYKTAYNSTLLNYADNDFQFEFVEFQPMDFQENTYTSNLVSVISYYLYMILALDFDSFSPEGGTQFYTVAQNIVNAAQNAPYPGWKAFESNKNRYWLLENLTNASYKDLRTFLYDYHRLGLDAMADNPEQGRSKISLSLNLLKRVYDERPGLMALRLFIDAKRDEIINIFSEGNPREKTDAQNIMKEIDAANSSSYSKITQRN